MNSRTRVLTSGRAPAENAVLARARELPPPDGGALPQDGPRSAGVWLAPEPSGAASAWLAVAALLVLARRAS